MLRVELALLDDALAKHADAAARLAREVEAFLADAHLRVDIVALCAPATSVTELVVHAGDLRDVRALLEELRAPCGRDAHDPDDARITVVYVRCLRFSHHHTGSSTSLDGYTTHIPGSVSPQLAADAILLGGGCELPRPNDKGLPRGLARDLAHEIGHYLGLFHSVEADAESTDTLDDTSGDDLMNARPSLGGARGLSPGQVAIMRAHPAVRWARPGREACTTRHEAPAAR